MLRNLPGLLVALIMLAPAARSDDDEPALPFNAFADAKEGDWETMIFQMELPGQPRYTDITTWRVKKVTDDEVSVDVETVHPGGSSKPDIMARKFPRKGTLTIRNFLNMQKEDKIEGWKSFARKFTLEGHSFDGTQMEFNRTGGRFVGKHALLVASEVKGGGLVVFGVQLPNGGAQQHHVVGFGMAEKKLWGKTADEIPIVEEKGAEKAIAFNLYQDKKNGFSIHAPRFLEIQERQAGQIFTCFGDTVSYGLVVQGDATDPKTFHEGSKKQIEKNGLKLVKDEDKKVSGKDAYALEYTGMFDTAQGKIKFHYLDLIIFRDAQVLTVRVNAPEKLFDGGALDKALRAAVSNVKLIDRGGVDDHKSEEAGVYYDHVYGLRLPIPELPKGKGDLVPVVNFQGAIEAHGNTSRVMISLARATARKDYKLPEEPGVEVVSKKELDVSGRPALQFETKGTIGDRPVQGLVLVVFDKARTYIVDAFGAKAAWEAEGDAFKDSVASFKLDGK